MGAWVVPGPSMPSCSLTSAAFQMFGQPAQLLGRDPQRLRRVLPDLRHDTIVQEVNNFAHFFLHLVAQAAELLIEFAAHILKSSMAILGHGVSLLPSGRDSSISSRSCRVNSPPQQRASSVTFWRGNTAGELRSVNRFRTVSVGSPGAVATRPCSEPPAFFRCLWPSVSPGATLNPPEADPRECSRPARLITPPVQAHAFHCCSCCWPCPASPSAPTGPSGLRTSLNCWPSCLRGPRSARFPIPL